MGIFAGILDGLAQIIVKLLPYIIVFGIALALFGLIISFLPVYVDPSTLTQVNFWGWVASQVSSIFGGIF